MLVTNSSPDLLSLFEFSLFSFLSPHQGKSRKTVQEFDVDVNFTLFSVLFLPVFIYVGDSFKNSPTEIQASRTGNGNCSRSVK